MSRNREISRLEALCDGVFAFAATLLVVSLEVPRTLSQLTSELYGFMGFGISFGALLLIWSVHNAFFRRYPLEDGWTIALNGLLLLVVLFYVYPLKFITGGLVSYLFPWSAGGFYLGGIEELGQLFALYSAGFVGVFFAIAMMYWHARSSAQKLALTPLARAEAGFYARHYLLFVAVGLLSVVLAALGVGVSIGLPGWIYAILGPVCWAHGVWSEVELAPLRLAGEDEPAAMGESLTA